MSNLSKNVSDQISEKHKAGDLEACIAIVTQALRERPVSPFHLAIDLDFQNSPTDIAATFESFVEDNELQVIYTETNGFDINPDSWFFDLFGFETCGDLGDESWFGDFDCDTAGGELLGMEALQSVYAKEIENRDLDEVRDIASLLVVLKFQRLIQKSLALLPNLDIPVIADAHDFGMSVVFGASLKKNKQKAQPRLSVLGAKPVEMKAGPPGRQKEVYAWAPILSKDGMPIGGQDPETYISEGVFTDGMPIDQAYAAWIQYPGIKAALQGLVHGASPNLVGKVLKTRDWMLNKKPLKYRTPLKKIDVERKDVLHLGHSLPFVNERVVAILKQIGPNDFEAFPIELMTSTGYSTRFYLINITHTIKNGIDREASKYNLLPNKKDTDFRSINSCTRLVLNKGCLGSLNLARVFEDPSLVMVSQKLISLFQKENVKGLEYVYLEDKMNRMFKSNYLPNGQLI